MFFLSGIGVVVIVDLCEGIFVCWVGGRFLIRGCLF